MTNSSMTQQYDYDVIVIGSGFGGSVTALRLTEKGYKVGVIESGRRWNAEDFPKTNWNIRKSIWAPKLGLTGPQRISALGKCLVFSGSAVGGGSIIYFLEAQAHYLGKLVQNMAERGGPLAVRADVERKFDEKIQGLLGGSVWSQCTSWYRQADGRITNNWPLLGYEYKAQAKFNPADYEVVNS